MIPPRRYLWRTAQGKVYRALGTPARLPDGRVEITTATGTRIVSGGPTGWYLQVSRPHGEAATVGPIAAGKSIPILDGPQHFPPPGTVVDFGAVILVDPDRYARHLDAEREDADFLAAWNAADDLDECPPDDDPTVRGEE
ncbi:MAG: hypothetical protein PWP08_1278 [Methanofollis sp.]|nr:hypothetical protein [Methanofollis sp.]